MIAVDTETRGLEYREGVLSVFMIQWADAHGEYVCRESDGWRPFLDALEAERAADNVLLFANASFDAHHLRASGIIDLLNDTLRVHDVQTLARVALPGRWNYRLETLGDDLLGKDSTVAQGELREAAKAHKLRWNKEDKDYAALDKLEPALMEKYGKEDVRLTWDVWAHIWSRASATDREVYRFEIAEVAPLLRDAERAGVRVHKRRLAALRARLEEERDELRCKLLALGLSDEAMGQDAEYDEDGELESARAPASSRALLADLLAAGVPLYRTTPKSKPPPDHTLAVNKDALIEFKDRFPIVGDLMEWRSRNQTLKTYVRALEAADPNVHTSFSQCEARTSRMSARRPNVQNLPRTVGVRDVLIPAPGNAFVVVDYDSIEVRVLAYYLANRSLIEQLDDGMDLHSRTAASVNGGKYEDYLKGGPNDEKRTVAKVTTFTALYGGGGPLLATRLNVSVNEAYAIKRAVLDAIPGYWDFDDRVKAAVRRRAWPHVTTILGRRLYVPKDYVGPNTLIQGTSAEIMKLGMVAAAPVLREHGFDIRLIVHDELVAEGPTGNAATALPATITAMQNAWPLSPRLVATGSWSADSYGKAK